jgi:hypothetical protein
MDRRLYGVFRPEFGTFEVSGDTGSTGEIDRKLCEHLDRITGKWMKSGLSSKIDRRLCGALIVEAAQHGFDHGYTD